MAERRTIENDQLSRYLRDELSEEDRAAVESQLGDPVVSAELEFLRQTEAALSYREPWIDQTDLAPRVRTALVQGRDRPRDRRWAWPMAFGTMLGAAAATLFFLFIRSPEVGLEDHGFRAKSAGAGVAADRWVGIDLYRPETDTTPAKMQDLDGQDEVLVGYTNLGSRPFDYLMVFAQDSTGQVFWLYPEYVDAASNPSAVAIERGASDVLLPDLVSHRFVRGPVVVRGLFLRGPLTVREVEALVDTNVDRLPIADSGQVARRFEMKP